MKEKVIRLENIEKKFAGVYALKGISFDIAPSEIHCLAGENGCGKSTLIKIISGVYQPDNGKVFLNGKTYPELQPIEAIQNGIQVIYQDFSLFSSLTVAENIAFNYQVNENKKIIDYKKMREIAKRGLERVGVDIDLDKIVSELSVADKQIVAISRALSAEHARLIIMDEPTTALTHHEIDRLLKIMDSLRSQGIAIIFVSHKLRELMYISDSITIMRNGEKVAEGLTSEFDEQKISFYMTGREFQNDKFKPVIEDGDNILEVKDLSYTPFFEDISFNLKKGEILGITGLLGCGRNEIAEALYGILKPNSGSITINGKMMNLGSIQSATSLGIGYVPEDRLTEGLFLPKSIFQNTIHTVYSKISNICGLLNFNFGRKMVSAKLKELKLNTTNIDMPVKNLSGGNQQRVVIAKWLVSDDLKLLILNGPSVGVDVGSKFEIHSKLKEIASQGIGVIVISDDIPELLENCSRLLMIYKGRLVKEISPYNESVESLTDALLQEY